MSFPGWQERGGTGSGSAAVELLRFPFPGLAGFLGWSLLGVVLLLVDVLAGLVLLFGQVLALSLGHLPIGLGC